MGKRVEMPDEAQPEVGDVRMVEDHPHDVPVEGSAPAMTDDQRTIQAMNVTIQALQQRIMRLEMEIVDGMSAGIAQQQQGGGLQVL
jgi:hypothetical protein